LQAQGKWSAGEGDDKERFLADLRTLRDTAALEFDELAARAHYPSDVLKEAESGPSLPGLPILAAYVRACDGDVPEWEERWRRLGFESRADPSLPVRPAGASPAAVAGARAAVSVAPPDVYDPERIRAALRGSHGRSDRGARGGASRAAPGRDAPGPATAEPAVPESPPNWSAETGVQRDGVARWDGTTVDLTGVDLTGGDLTGADLSGADLTGADLSGADLSGADLSGADLSGAHANGNHHASQPGDGSPDLAVTETPDAATADAIRRDPFSAAWLHDGGRAAPTEPGSGWPDQAEAGPQAADPDSWFIPRQKADSERIEPTADGEPSAAAADGWFSPRERADSGVAPPHPAEPDAPPAQEHAGSAAAGMAGFWTPSADVSAKTPASDPPRAADRTKPLPTQATAAAPSRTMAGPAVPPRPVVPQSESRPDRFYAMRLLVIIVVAALIGSVLVLLLR
jgi:Pentapeptide repeats (8 copies)